MSIFITEEDAIRFAIRRIYLDVLHREIESVRTQDDWVTQWRAHGGDFVLGSIMDSPEGQKCIKATRDALGL